MKRRDRPAARVLCALIVALLETGGAACSSGIAGLASSQSEVVTEVGAGFVELQTGQILVIRHPGDSRQWQVTGVDGVLEQLSPKDDVPVGPEGWRFRARLIGNGELTFTGHAVPSCPDPPRCPPGVAPPTFQLTVHVTR